MLSSQGRAPRLGERVFVTPTATVVGDVVLGDDERIRVADTAVHYVATKESARCREDGP
jgi:carbonic anhydrase/acetyltransferase-like protein (isoleucine patch superfamily)